MGDKVTLSIRQLIEAWQVMCIAAPGHTMAAGSGIEYVFSGLPIPFFNVAFITQRGLSGAALRSHGQNACEWAGGKGVPWFLLVTHEALEAGTDAVAALSGCGLQPMVPLTGMLAERVPPAKGVPEGLEMRVPDDDAGCSAIVSVNGAAYGMSLDASMDALGKRSFWKDHFGIVGLAGGKPVSCAAVMMLDGYRYVFFVATDPAHQRRGYAEAVMRRALEVSAQAHGEQPTFLHATEAGRPVYERMGYAPVSTHTLFIEQKFLGGH